MVITFFFMGYRFFMASAIHYCCPLCEHPQLSDYHTDKKRTYLQCSNCDLVSVKPEQLPTKSQELAEYNLHNNDESDPGYQRFLERLLTPLVPLLPGLESGLDFGCGPTPLLAKMLSERGVPMKVYDPFFADDPMVLTGQYDLITCSEAIEHFHQPKIQWRLWQTLLAPQGLLAIMTKRVIDAERFAQWHYKNDPTHVSFFSQQTFEFLAHEYGYDVEFPTSDVVLMRKI